jgi:hypothetical protein
VFSAFLILRLCSCRGWRSLSWRTPLALLLLLLLLRLLTHRGRLPLHLRLRALLWLGLTLRLRLPLFAHRPRLWDCLRLRWSSPVRRLPIWR